MARVIITVPDDFLAQIDETARNEHRSRSELIREALRQYVTQRQTALRQERAASEVREAVGIIEHLRTQAATRARLATSSVEAIRTFRGQLRP